MTLNYRFSSFAGYWKGICLAEDRSAQWHTFRCSAPYKYTYLLTYLRQYATALVLLVLRETTRVLDRLQVRSIVMTHDVCVSGVWQRSTSCTCCCLSDVYSFITERRSAPRYSLFVPFHQLLTGEAKLQGNSLQLPVYTYLELYIILKTDAVDRPQHTLSAINLTPDSGECVI